MKEERQNCLLRQYDVKRILRVWKAMLFCKKRDNIQRHIWKKYPESAIGKDAWELMACSASANSFAYSRAFRIFATIIVQIYAFLLSQSHIYFEQLLYLQHTLLSFSMSQIWWYELGFHTIPKWPPNFSHLFLYFIPTPSLPDHPMPVPSCP